MTMAERMKRLGAVKATETGEQVRQSGNVGAKTAVGGNMILSAHLNNANEKIAELEKKLQSGSISELPLIKIKEIEGRRRKLTVEEYEELRTNLEHFPLTTPVTVIARANDTFELLAGYNRVAAYKDLGRESIRASVIEIDESQIESAAFFSNLFSPTLSDFEKYLGFQSLQRESGINQLELAKAAGISAQHVSRIMKFDLLPPDAKLALSKRPERLGSAAAEQMVEAGKEAPERIVSAIQLLVNDLSMTQAKAVAMVRQPAKPKTVAESAAVKVGKRKLCEVVRRGNTIGVTFSASETGVEEWAKKIHAFLQAEANQEEDGNHKL
jgi:ParB family chromosome partitioning protein